MQTYENILDFHFEYFERHKKNGFLKVFQALQMETANLAFLDFQSEILVKTLAF